METIYSVEEVAAILKLQPFTVRKMFRENKLSGFKIGKAWRISERRLEADIMRLQESAEFADRNEPTPASIPEIVPTEDPEELVESMDSAPRESLQNTEPSPYRSLVSKGAGSLLIFSESPGEEVFLNGEHQGPTTLSLLDIEEGEYRLQVGDVIDTITVLPNSELRVNAVGGVLSTTIRGATSTPAPTVDEIDAKLLVRLENQSALTGTLLIQLSGENTKATHSIFADYASDDTTTAIQLPNALVRNKNIVEGKVQLLNTLARNETEVVFDGPITYVEGNRLEVTVPKQSGIDKEIQQTFPITEDMSITIMIVGGGMLRGKPTLRIKREK